MNKIRLAKLHGDINIVCDYLAYDEKKHYEESGRPKDHIWSNIKRIRKWLRAQT